MSVMNEKVYIGIDPGKDGALVLLQPDGVVKVTAPFDERQYLDMLRTAGDSAFAIVENVHAMKGQGVSSMFNFGRNFGWLQGALMVMGIPFELVMPQKWKKVYGCTSDKNTSIQVAQRLFPNVDLRKTPKCKGPHDGICEALLMAEYGRRVYNGQH